MNNTVKDMSRFSPISSDDHAGYLWIAAILGLVYTFLSAFLRAHIKWGMYGWDDALLAMATFFHLGQSVVVFDGLRNGLGRSSHSLATAEALHVVGKAFITAEILAVFTLCLSKCSTLSMMLRLWTKDVDQRKWATCFMVMIFSGLWGIGSSLAVSLNCDASSTMTVQNVKYCPNQLARWQAIATIDALTDLIISILPVILTWRLSMSVKWKIQVLLAFGFRIFVIPVSLLHVLFFRKYPHAAEPQFTVVPCLLLQQAMLTCSLVSATIPNLKSFMKSFSWGLGLGGMSGITHAYANDHELQTIGRISTRKSRRDQLGCLSWDRESYAGLYQTFRPVVVQRESVVTHEAADEAADGQSLSNHDSHDIIIRRMSTGM